MYDAKLNTRAIDVLEKAPIAMAMVGYWALGNRQMFFNENREIAHLNVSPDPGHPLVSFKYGVNHTHLVLLFLIYLVIASLFGDWLYAALDKCGFARKQKKVDVDEGLDSYWEALVGKEQKEWYAAECYQRKNLGIKTVSDKGLERLRTAKRLKKHFEGSYNYEIVNNPRYCELFQF